MDHPLPRLRRFVRELKRRHVARVAAVYAAVAFVVVQAADLLFPALLLPSWMTRAVVVLVLLGFPVALVLAWAFELTPGGVRRVGEGAVPRVSGEAGAGREAGDVPGAGPRASTAGSPARSEPWLSPSWAAAVGGLVLVGVALGWLLGGSAGSVGRGLAASDAARSGAAEAAGGAVTGRGPLIQLSVTLPEGDTLGPYGRGPRVAVSPYGDELVYVGVRQDTVRLYRRALGQTEVAAIEGTEGAHAPFYAPDGRWIGFFADGRMMKVSVEGGPPVEIAELEHLGADWGPGDTIVVGFRGSGPDRGLWRVPARGGEPERMTRTGEFDLERPEQTHVWPQVLAGGEAILYTSWNLPEDMRVAVYDRESGDERIVVERGGRARYVATGHLVYGWGGDLLAVPFDLEQLEVTGPAVPVLEGVATAWDGSAEFDVSRTGTLVRVPGRKWEAPRRLAWVGHDGSVEELRFPPGAYGSARVSPDGKRLVGTIFSDRIRLWLFDPDRGMAQRLSEDEPMVFWPLWSPDGRHVVHNSNRDGGPALDLYLLPVDGSGPPERLTSSPYHKQPQTWTPDGATLLYTVANHPETGGDIWEVDLVRGSEPRPLLETPADELLPALSPDGRWLAYVSDRSGRLEVYLRPYPGPGGVVQVSPRGGLGPLWAPDGETLYFRDATGDTVWTVPFEASPAPVAGAPRVLFTGRFVADTRPGRRYDLAPDGSRFLVLREADPEEERRYARDRIDVIVNWFGELERLAGPGGRR